MPIKASKFYRILLFLKVLSLSVLGSIALGGESVEQKSEINLLECYDVFANTKYVSALRKKLEEDLFDETFYPSNQAMYEIIWYKPGKIRAIIELDDNKKWNGSIHSWYQNGAYLGCAGLKNRQHIGISIAYHENGNHRAIANFADGIPVGIEYQFNKLGQLSSTKDHDEPVAENNTLKEFKH